MADFHWPAAARDGDEVGHRGGPVFRRPAEVERVLVLLAGGQAADQQEFPRARGGDEGPVAVAGAFRPIPAGSPLEHRVCYGLVSADDRVLREGDAVVAGDDDDVGQRQCPARVPELAAPPVHFVGGGPQGADPGRHQAPELLNGQFRFRGELQVPRDAGLAAALRVFRPAFGHVHVKIGPRLAECGDQGGEYPGHAVLDLAGDARVLRRDARGGPSLLQVRGLVDRDPRPDQVIRVIRQALRRQRRQQRAERLPRPLVPPEQGLHPVRSLVPGRLCQFPAVRPRSPRQRLHVIQRRRDAAPLPHHPAQHPADQAIRSLPALRGIFYAGHCGRGHLLFFHKIQERATAAPRCTPASRGPAGNSRPISSRAVTPAVCPAITQQAAPKHSA